MVTAPHCSEPKSLNDTPEYNIYLLYTMLLSLPVEVLLAIGEQVLVGTP
jgi:hypothetical protein